MMPNIYNFISSKKNKTFVVLKPSKIDFKTIQLLAEQVKFSFSLKPEKETKFYFKTVEKFENASHHMGGLRFNPNKNLSVVDKNLRIIGLKKIYVCSSAIFPTSWKCQSHYDSLCIK